MKRRRPVRLTPAERDDVVAWGRSLIADDKRRVAYGEVLAEIAARARALSALLDVVDPPLYLPVEGSSYELRRSPSRTHGAIWLEDWLARLGMPLRTVSEWSSALSLLAVAAQYGSPVEMKPGTMGGFDEAGHIAGPVWDLTSGDEVDRRGRKRARPLLERLVLELLDRSYGRLTFDKNTGSGSLGVTLDDLRRDLPEVVPRALPLTTIGRVVGDWRKRPRRRARKPTLKVVDSAGSKKRPARS